MNEKLEKVMGDGKTAKESNQFLIEKITDKRRQE